MSLLKNKTNKLLLRFKSGDGSALKELFDFLFKKLVVVAGMNLYDKSQAEDVVSQTFMQICKSIDSFDKDKDGYNWIYKIVKNKALDANRQYKEKNQLDETMPSPDVFDSVNNQADIYFALRKLDLGEQKLIKMRFFEDKTYAVISEETGMSPQMVQRRIEEILKKLKNFMKD